VVSIQTLDLADRRLAAGWAALCVEHVLELVEVAAPDDGRPRALVERTRSFAAGDVDAARGIRDRFRGGVGVGEVDDPVAAAVARAAGQAAAVCHMGAHALGAAAYAALAAALAHPDRPSAAADEIAWQVAQADEAVRAVLRTLPAAGTDRHGPLGPGLLTSGRVGALVRQLQQGLADPTSP